MVPKSYVFGSFLTCLAVACGSGDGSSGAPATTSGGTGGATSTGAPSGAGATAGGATAGGPTSVGTFEVPSMNIEMDNAAAISSKDTYLPGKVTIDGKGSFANFEGRAGVRGRGNSTWLWYPKKPYRIKLDAESEILGLKSNKDWVLLANYRDPTFLMNAFAFELADWMSLPYTNHSRFVEVTLNGDFIGLYQLTEQIEQGADRVAVADLGGILLSLDADDGPEMVPNATDNFASTRYGLPVAVKYPQNQTPAQLSAIQADFATLEDAIAKADYDAVTAKLDIGSLIDFLIVQEVVYNVELITPRSMYLHKNPGGVYVMGPVWDFDGGFDFDWTFMETSHDYFAEQTRVMGDDPARSADVSQFFVGMFKNARFVTEYKSRWAAIKTELLPHCWGVMESTSTSLSAALDRNAQRWPIGKDHRTETARLKQWLEARVPTLDAVINAYPAN